MATVFHKEQRALTDEERDLGNQIKAVAQDLHDLLDMVPMSRDRDAAMMRLQESVMWALKAIADKL
jgi:hypothetical protein